MPNRCVAANCSNKASKDVSLHLWPTDKAQADAWRRFVATKRSHWKPSPRSILCSAHFTGDCFENQLKFSMGYGTRLILRPGAVPTIHTPPQLQNVPTVSAASSQGLCTVTTSFASFGRVKATDSQQLTSAQCTLAPSTASLPKPSVVRSAVRKREVSRVNISIINLQSLIQCDSQFSPLFPETIVNG